MLSPSENRVPVVQRVPNNIKVYIHIQVTEALKAKLDCLHQIVFRRSFPVVAGSPKMESWIRSQSRLKTPFQGQKTKEKWLRVRLIVNRNRSSLIATTGEDTTKLRCRDCQYRWSKKSKIQGTSYQRDCKVQQKWVELRYWKISDRQVQQTILKELRGNTLIVLKQQGRADADLQRKSVVKPEANASFLSIPGGPHGGIPLVQMNTHGR